MARSASLSQKGRRAARILAPASRAAPVKAIMISAGKSIQSCRERLGPPRRIDFAPAVVTALRRPARRGFLLAEQPPLPMPGGADSCPVVAAEAQQCHPVERLLVGVVVFPAAESPMFRWSRSFTADGSPVFMIVSSMRTGNSTSWLGRRCSANALLTNHWRWRSSRGSAGPCRESEWRRESQGYWPER
jgi:hypothetical protein